MSRIPKPLNDPSTPDPQMGTASTATLGLVSLIAFSLSFHSLASLAHAAGYAWILAAGVPLIIDGWQVAASLRVIDRAQHGRSARVAWAAILVSTLLSMLGNGVSAHVFYGDQTPLLAGFMMAIGVAAPGILTWVFHMAIEALQDRRLAAAAAAERRFGEVLAQASAVAQPPAGLPTQRPVVPVVPVPVAHGPEPMAQVPADGPEPVAHGPVALDHLDHPADQVPDAADHASEQVPGETPAIEPAPELHLVQNTNVHGTPVDLASVVRTVLDQWTEDGREFGPEDWPAVVKAAPALAGKQGYARPGREVPKRVAAYLAAKSQEKIAA